MNVGHKSEIEPFNCRPLLPVNEVQVQYGFHLAPNPYEQNVISWIQESHKKGSTYQEITAQLNKQCVPFNSKDGSWSQSTVGRIVRENSRG